MPSLDQQLTACAIKYLGGGSQGRLSADGIRRKAMIQYLGGAASLGRLTTEALASRCARQYTGQTFSGMSLNGLLLRWAYAVAGVGAPGRRSLEGIAMFAANKYLTLPPPPVNSVLPAITGTAQVGQTLTSSNGTWSGSPTFTRQWKANGTNISGATNSTYVPVVGDIGKTITVTVTATNAGGSATATSAATAAVVSAAKTYADFQAHIATLATNGVAGTKVATGSYRKTVVASAGDMYGSPWVSNFLIPDAAAPGLEADVLRVLLHGFPSAAAYGVSVTGGFECFFNVLPNGNGDFSSLVRNGYTSLPDGGPLNRGRCSNLIYWDGTQAQQMNPFSGSGPTPYTIP